MWRIYSWTRSETLDQTIQFRPCRSLRTRLELSLFFSHNSHYDQAVNANNDEKGNGSIDDPTLSPAKSPKNIFHRLYGHEIYLCLRTHQRVKWFLNQFFFLTAEFFFLSLNIFIHFSFLYIVWIFLYSFQNFSRTFENLKILFPAFLREPASCTHKSREWRYLKKITRSIFIYISSCCCCRMSWYKETSCRGKGESSNERAGRRNSQQTEIHHSSLWQIQCNFVSANQSDMHFFFLIFFIVCSNEFGRYFIFIFFFSSQIKKKKKNTVMGIILLIYHRGQCTEKMNFFFYKKNRRKK